MIRKALMTMAVLGATSTAALARPIISADVGVEASWTSSPTVDVRDHRYDTNYTYVQPAPAPVRVDFRQMRFARRFQHRPRYEQPMFMLSEVNRIAGSNAEGIGRAFVNLNGARASELTLQANGPMQVTMIGIEYYTSTGIQTQIVRPNVVLDRFGSTYSFGLGGNVSINRVIVYGRNMSMSSGFSLLGR